MTNRHPGVQQLLTYFAYDHLSEGAVRTTSMLFSSLANTLDNSPLNDSPEFTAGLRKLLEAKDCFVRQAVTDAGMK